MVDLQNSGDDFPRNMRDASRSRRALWLRRSRDAEEKWEGISTLRGGCSLKVCPRDAFLLRRLWGDVIGLA